MSRFLLFISLFLPFAISAQEFLGYTHSNYAGIVGAQHNPASLADSYYSLDILLVGFGVEAANNYVGVKRKDIYKSDFGNQYLYLRERNTKKSVFFSNEILLPGFMVSNEKFGWGIDMRIRTYANVDGVSRDFAHIIAKGFDDPDYLLSDRHDRHVGATALSWFELGGTYAKTIWTGEGHFVSVGVRPKLLLGLAAAYVFVNNFQYDFTSDSTLAAYNADVKFAHSTNLSFDGAMSPSYHLKFNPGIGVDAGIIYEKRPEEMQKDNDKKFRKWPGYRERAAYKYRIAVSLTDLGIIHFKSGELSDHYTTSSDNWDIKDSTLNNPTTPSALYQTFTARVGGANAGDPFWMRLPLALNVNLDYKVREYFYVNACSFSGLYFRNFNGKKVHELTRLSITPRWEKRWYGVWAPVSFTRMGTFSLGAGIRLGPVVVGTDDILNLMLKRKKIYNENIYFVVKIPLFPIGGGKGKKGKQKKDGPVDKCPD
jgi:hypothetical protein